MRRFHDFTSAFAVRFPLSLLGICFCIQVTPFTVAGSQAIVRLEPSQFELLPVAVRQNLTGRGCRIPQPSAELVDPRGPRNVIQGAFTGAGRTELAVLCSVRDTSRILIYSRNSATPIDSIAREADAGRVQGLGGTATGYSRLIGTSPAANIRRLHAQFNLPPNATRLPADATNDGIDDAFLGKASMIHFWYSGRWLLLYGAD